MTIAQRIELRRQGYTKEEIAELAELEVKQQTIPEEPVAPDPEEPEQLMIDLPTPAPAPAPDVQAQLLTAINNLTAVLQNQKLNQTAQPETRKETTDDIMNNLLRG